MRRLEAQAALDAAVPVPLPPPGETRPLRDDDLDRKLPPTLRRVWMLVLGCAAASTLFHLENFLVRHTHGHYVWPFSLNDRDRFADFTIFRPKYMHWHKPDFFLTGFPINYPAPLADFFEVFFHYFAYPTTTFVVFTTLCMMVPCVLFARALRARGIRPVVAALYAFTLFVFSWPALLLIDGANMEVAVWVVMAIGFWGLATRRDNLAAIGFGLAGSFKLFPFILLAVFLSQRKYGKLLLGIAVMLCSSLLALWILGPTVRLAWAGIAYGLDSFKVNYMAQWRSGENGVDHSLFALFKFTTIVLHLHRSTVFTRPLQVYLWLTALGGAVLYFGRIRLQPLVNQVLLLTISCIYLTAFSGDGTLIHLYGPFAMLTFLVLDAWRRGVRIPGLEAAMLLLTLILSPVSFLIYRDHRVEGEVKAVLLGVLFYVALRYPFGPSLSRGDDQPSLAHPNASLIHGAVSLAANPDRM